MCFAIAKIPHGTALYRELFGVQKADEQQQIQTMTREAEKVTRNPLSVGKNRSRAKSNTNPNI